MEKEQVIEIPKGDRTLKFAVRVSKRELNDLRQLDIDILQVNERGVDKQVLYASCTNETCNTLSLVLPDYHRGAGIGTRLWQTAEEILRREGIKLVEGQINPAVDNAAKASNFWKKQGFKTTRGGDFIKIKKKLQ